MRVTIATDPAPGHRNEDFAAATAGGAVLLDGAGLSGVDDGGCVHGVAWYVRRLGTEILVRLVDPPVADLNELLAAAITAVAEAHAPTCDLEHPGTPSSTVVIVAEGAGLLRYLVLADSVLVVDSRSEVRAITDDREAVTGRRYRAAMDALAGGSSEHDDARRRYVQQLRSHRNQPGGFWVAAGAPEAAEHALSGEFHGGDVNSAVLLSDGASRLVDRFGLWNWRELGRHIADTGAVGVLRAVRDAERSDPAGRRWPRGKVFDDATIVVCDQIQA